MDRKSMIETLMKQTNYTNREVRRFVKALAGVMLEELVAGGEIYLPGIGKFFTHRAGPWKGRDPRTKEPMDIPPKWRVKFAPCQEVRHRVENTVKLYEEEDLLERYGLKKEEDDGEVRSADRSGEGRKGKARKRFPWM